MISYGLLQMDQSRNTVLAQLFMSLAMVFLGSLDFLVPSCEVASLHGCHMKSKHCLSLLQPNILVLSLSSLVIMLASPQTVNHVYMCTNLLEALPWQFSASPAYPHFFSTISRYQTSVRHPAGSVNTPSDFASRNAPDCLNPDCQICTFMKREEEPTVLHISTQDVISGHAKLP